MNNMKGGRVRKVIGWKSADSRAACNPEMNTHRNNTTVWKRKLQNAVSLRTTLKFNSNVAATTSAFRYTSSSSLSSSMSSSPSSSSSNSIFVISMYFIIINTQ